MKVSVIVATFGDRAWTKRALTRAIPSVVGQGAFELIPHHTNDGTLADARNDAAGDAKGDWLCFLDADDELAPGYLSAMKRTGDGYCPRLLAPSVQYVHEDGREQPPILPNREADMAVLNHCVIGTLVPRELFLDAGGFREHPIYEDWAFFLDCVRRGAEIVDVPGAVYRAHVRDRSRNTRGREAFDTYWQIRREHEEALV